MQFLYCWADLAFNIPVKSGFQDLAFMQAEEHQRATAETVQRKHEASVSAWILYSVCW